MVESKVFTDKKGFNKEWKKMRKEVLKRKGLNKKKYIRMTGYIVMYEKFYDGWYPVADTLEIMNDMVVKKSWKDNTSQYKLVIMGNPTTMSAI